MEKKIIRSKEVDSTNAFLKNLDTYDEDALTIAIADYQTSVQKNSLHKKDISLHETKSRS